MKKAVKQVSNALVEQAYEEFREYHKLNPMYKYTQVRRCQAWSTPVGRRYIALVSYHTIVSFIDLETDTCYDVLRLVYGYTATSAQHISKWYDDYSRHADAQPSMLRWYNIA